MSGVKWTDNQLDAIKARDGAVLVSAAAGSGKTAVLVERVIDMITDPDNPADADRFLIVTYTKAAAGEMKERIGARLDELLKSDPANENLRRQQMLLTKAQISTIDSFCSSIAREFFYTLDIPGDFRIGEKEELDIIKTNAVTEVFERRYAAGDEAFENMVEVFSSSRDDGVLQDIVLRLYEFLRSHPFPEQWIAEKYSMYSTAQHASQTAWGKAILGRTVVLSQFVKSLGDRNIERLDEEPKLRDSSFGDSIRCDSDFIETLIRRIDEEDWDEIARLLDSYSPKRLTPPKGYADNEIKKAIAADRDTVKSIIKEMSRLFISDNERCIEDIADLAPTVRCLFDVMLEFGELYSNMKKERSLADFPDLEHWTLRLLVRNTENGVVMTDIARQISSRYDYVMVDEYQDANSIQDTIFKAVSDHDKKLFVVGDVKQSIYRFRQAMPEIFIGRKNKYKLYDRSSEKYPAKIILDRNFRSREGVTDAVNFVFRNLMSENVGDIAYTEEEALTAGAAYDEDNTNSVSFHLLGTDNSYTKDKDKEEALYIGHLIREMMSTQTVSTKNGKRRPQFGDFCILMRGIKKHADVFVDELKKQGIPAVSESSDSFFSRREIKTMLSLLRVIDNPVQDIPLAAVLLSPLFGFTADELTDMRVRHKNGTMYSVILKENAENNKKTASFTEKLEKLREAAASLPTDALLNRIYAETSYPEIVSAEADGEYKRKNLRLLLQYAKNYENAGYRGVGGFVRFIDRIEENGGDLACAEKQQNASDNVVRIMTIHKSKGLEFPICIVANMSRRINTDTTKEVLLHNELGLGVRRKDDKRMCRFTTMPREAVSLEIKRNEMSEELRVLYVAMTRAKEKLVLVSSVPDTQKYVENIAKNLVFDGAVTQYSVSSAGSLSDWITQCVLVHPQCKQLRDDSGYSGGIYTGGVMPWDVTVINNLTEYYANKTAAAKEQDDAAAGNAADEKKHEDYGKEQVNEALAVLKERLSAEYAYRELTEIPVKVSASALAHRDDEKKFAAVSKPEFMNKGALSGAQRGTALHTFVQYCDFAKAREDVESEIERLVDGGFITEVQGGSVDKNSVETFVHSPLMARMLRSPMLEREYRFTVEIPASSVDGTLEFPYSEEQIILQGAIDCMFEEQGRIVIVDYKTDRVKEAGELAEMYKEQLRLYKLAVEQITGKRVSECLLYSFELGCEIAVQ